METTRIEMRGVIKGKIFMKASEEAAEQYESSRKRAMNEALETAIEVIKKENEDRILAKCNKIKDQYIKELVPGVYKTSSQ